VGCLQDNFGDLGARSPRSARWGEDYACCSGEAAQVVTEFRGRATITVVLSVAAEIEFCFDVVLDCATAIAS
jgi:hypothetical protein